MALTQKFAFRIRADVRLRTALCLVRVVRRLGTARLRPGGILCHAQQRGKQRYCDRGVAVPQNPGSRGFFSPPLVAGRTLLVALPFASHSLMLFDFSTQKWEEITKLSLGFPNWSKTETKFTSCMGRTSRR